MNKEEIEKLTAVVATTLHGIQVAAVTVPTLLEAAQPVANSYYTTLMKAALAAYGEAQEAGLSDDKALELTKAVLAIKFVIPGISEHLK